MKTLYLDESGNTGIRYLVNDQPIYVLGGWLIDTDRVDQFNTIVTEWESSLGYDTGAEIKSGVIARRPDKNEKLLELFNAIVQLEAIPVFAAQEKKFGICALFFEAFFGTRPNEGGYQEYINNAHMRIAAVDSLYRFVSDQFLRDFEANLVANNIERFRTFYNSVPGIVGCPQEHIRSLEMVNEFLFGGTYGDRNGNASHMFYSALSLARNAFEGAWDIIHDESLGMENFGRHWVVEMNRDAQPTLKLSSGVELLFGDYEISSIHFTHHQESVPMLRASDFLVGTVMRIMKSHSDGNGKDWAKELKRLLFVNDQTTMLTTSNALRENIFSGIVTSDWV